MVNRKDMRAARASIKWPRSNVTGVFTRIRPTINQTRQGSPVSNTIYPISKHRWAIWLVVFVSHLDPSCFTILWKPARHLSLLTNETTTAPPCSSNFPSIIFLFVRPMHPTHAWYNQLLPPSSTTSTPTIELSSHLRCTLVSRMARVIFT